MPSQPWEYDVAAFNSQCGNNSTGSGTGSKVAMVNDITFPAYFFTPGTKLRATIYAGWTANAASGDTIIFSVNLGGTGGTALATSAAIEVPELGGGGTYGSLRWETLIVCTVGGSSGTLFAQGWIATTSTGTGGTAPYHYSIPSSAPAGTTALNLTTSQALDFAVNRNSTGIAWVSNLYTLEQLGI